MKGIFTLLVIFASAVLSGCATGGQLSLEPVGPPPQSALANLTSGTLLVYSAYDVNASFNNRDPSSPVHSDYKILTAEGRLLQKVHNNSGTLLQDPVTVELPAGRYRIVARSNGYGKVTVPVMVASRQTTVLNLEGGGFWPDESAFNRTNAVYLSDGV